MGLILLIARTCFPSCTFVPLVVQDFQNHEGRKGTRRKHHVHQQALSGTHKNLQRLVICPIYSVVKYRPRDEAASSWLLAISQKTKINNLSLPPPQRVWVLLTPECANSRIPPTQYSMPAIADTQYQAAITRHSCVRAAKTS